MFSRAACRTTLCAASVMFRDKGSTPNDAGLDVRAEQNAGTLAGNEGKTIDLSPDPCQPATKEEVHLQGGGGRGGEQVVLVTGGAGFLGQYVVRLLHERATGVREIRVLDTKPFTPAMDYPTRTSVRSWVGDVRDLAALREATRGADTVIHTAARVSFGTHPDLVGMRNVNVKGTQNVIRACLEEGVSRLVLTSTVDVVVGHNEIHDGNEDIASPSEFLFPGYPETKHAAEKLVLQANGSSGKTGVLLHTVSLRPNIMYGELDPFYVPGALKLAHSGGGVLQRIGDGTALFQHAYVGNIAWGHLKAVEALTTDPQGTGGHAFFLTDDSPVQNTFQFLRPFLKLHNMDVSAGSLPFWLVYGLVFVAETTALWLRPLVKISLPTSCCDLIYINNTYYFNRSKAERMLGYQPLFSQTESKKRSLEYYKSVKPDKL